MEQKNTPNHMPAPNPDQNRIKLLEIMAKQLEFQYSKFDKRRAYEWKLCLAIWAALAAFIAITFKGETSLPNNGFTWVALIVSSFLIVLLHGYFLWNMKRANDADKANSWVFEKELRNALVPDKEKWEKADEAVRIARYKGSNGMWAPNSQICITLVLIFCAILVIYSKVTVTKETIKQKYNIETSIGTYTIKQEENNLYEVINWEPNCPLPMIFSLKPEDINIANISNEKTKQKAIKSLLVAKDGNEQ